MERRHRIRTVAAVLMTGCVFCPCAALADTEGWGTIQITHDSYDDFFPRISGPVVVWQAQVGRQDWEILYFNINQATVHQLTNNEYNDLSPVIQYPYVAWQANCGPGGTYEIWYCDLSAAKPSPVRLTDNNYEDLYPDVSAITNFGSHPHVVWQGQPPKQDWEIFRFDGTRTEQLTNDAKDDQLPKVSGESIVWRNGDGMNEWEIYLYDGTVPSRLTDTLYPETRPQISGPTVAWEGFDGSDWEVYAYYRRAIKNVSNNISADDRYPVLNGSLIAWQWGESPQIQVDIYDLEENTLYLMSGAGDDAWPRVFEPEVVWERQDGAESYIEYYSPLGLGRKSFSRMGFVYERPDVYDSVIVWQGSDRGLPNTWEIFLAFRCLPELHFDYNDDCVVDFEDLAIWAAEWLECRRWPQALCDYE